jgi:hypothetical protein
LKSKIYWSIIVLVLLCVAYDLGYHSGYKRSQYGVVLVGFDPKDIPQQSSMKSEYEPYFTKHNPIPAQIK